MHEPESPPRKKSRFFFRVCACSRSPEEVMDICIEAARDALEALGPAHSEKSYEEVMDICIEAAREALEALGPAHSEKSYEEVICNKLYDARVPVRRQANVCQVVDGHVVQTGIVDLEVDHSVVLELKANHASISGEHQAQLRRYLRSLAADAHSDRRMLGAVLLFAKDGTLRVWRAEADAL